jgi:mannonate dehydratase
MLDDAHFAFARQSGATDVVVHLVDYHQQADGTNLRGDQPLGGSGGWGIAGSSRGSWTVDALLNLRARVEAHGLQLAAIENLDPADWYDVLLDGPERDGQIEKICQIIRNLGQAGIPALGYNFSIAGVAGRIVGPFARGGAKAVGMDGIDQTPIPNGMVWNMVYRPDARSGHIGGITHEMLWDRVERFLRQVVPVAGEAGVRLAAHPDDPPVPTLRQSPRLVYQPHLYRRLLAAAPDPANGLEFCVGTLAEMTDGDIYEITEHYAALGRIVYVHLRNVRGKVPHYQETFIDDGDVNIRRIIEILGRNGFDGVIIPDHAPQMSCSSPWHAGMAFTMGYLRALLDQSRARAGGG